jgi:hypothetical protein
MGKKVIFLHGYGGEPIDEVGEIFDGIGWEAKQPYIDYDREWDLDHCKSMTERVVEESRDCDLIVGLSMGGYTAHLVANHLGKDCIIINPGIDRERSQVFLGNQFPTSGEEYEGKDFDFPMEFNRCNLEIYLGRRDFQIPNHYTTDYVDRMGILCDVRFLDDMYHVFNRNEFISILGCSRFIQGGMSIGG